MKPLFKLKKMNIDIDNITDEHIENLIHQLTRSGKVIIPDYYHKGTMKEIFNKDMTDEDMINLQVFVEDDDYFDGKIQDEIDYENGL